jgi:hypothetical protein
MMQLTADVDGQPMLADRERHISPKVAGRPPVPPPRAFVPAEKAFPAQPLVGEFPVGQSTPPVKQVLVPVPWSHYLTKEWPVGQLLVPVLWSHYLTKEWSVRQVLVAVQ